MAGRHPIVVKNDAQVFRLGDYWLAWRTDREEWAICGNDKSSGFRRRKSTGIRDRGRGDPPLDAQKALAAHFAAAEQADDKPVARLPQDEARVSPILTKWLVNEASKRARAAQYGYAVKNLERFFADERATGLLTGGPVVEDLTPARIQRYVKFRIGEGVKGETIHGELAALRRALRWAQEPEQQYIASAPQIPQVDVNLRSGPKEVEYSVEQLAAILGAATQRVEREHVALFAMIMLSTHGRVEAVLELEADQISRGLIMFNEPGRRQTTKKRAIVPVAPSLAPWLKQSNGDDLAGKVIRYRVPIREDKWKDPNVPEFYERPTDAIRNAWSGTLLAAAEAHPKLGLSLSVGTGDGPNTIRALGSPNTLRHTCHTWLQRVGVPQAQIDTAAGHSGEKGSGRNYTHLRPEYLSDLIEGVELLWTELDRLTGVHRRSQGGPKIITFGPRIKRAAA